MLYSQIISNFSELKGYEREWNALVVESNDNIFLSWEWISTWWEFFGKDSILFVVLVKNEKGEVVGIAPLKISLQRVFGFVPARLVEFIGSNSLLAPEYLDFIVSKQNYPEIVEEIVSALTKNRKSWDVLNLSDIDESSPVLPVLNQLFSRDKMVIWQRVYNTCPSLKLPASWDELLSSYSHNMRRTIRRTRKRLEESSGIRFVHVEDSNCLPQAFQHAARLHQLSRQKKGEKGNFGKKNYLPFHLKFAQAIASKNWLYLAFIEADKKPIAFRYGYLYNQKYYDYQTGYDPQFEKSRVGWVMLGYVIEDLIQKSVREFDFLRGGHDYKWHWAKGFRRTVFFCSFQYNPTSLLLYLWWRVKKQTKKLLFPPESEVPCEKN